MIRRAIIQLTVFVLLGAIMNIGVAWAFAWRGRDLIDWDIRSLTNDENARLASLGWTFEPPRSPWFTGQRLRGWDQDSVIATWSGRTINSLTTVRAGWPVRALEGTRDLRHAAWVQKRTGVSPNDDVCHWSIPVSTSFQYAGAMVPTDRLLPLRPMWPGFALNTLLYAAALWLPVAAILAIRRSERIRRGRCPNCAYPIGASDRCSECGRPVTPRGVGP